MLGSSKRGGLAVGHVLLFDDFSITVFEDCCTAQFADLVICTFDHAMLLASLACFYLTGFGNLETLFSARLRFHFGHFGLQ